MNNMFKTAMLMAAFVAFLGVIGAMIGGRAN
jgi:heat shock protein HtpX